MINKVGAIILKERKLLVVREHGKNVFILPGGRANENERPEETLTREINEELGTKPMNIKYLGTFEDKAEFEDDVVRITAFLSDIKNEIKASSEVAEFSWIDRNYRGIKIASIIKKFIIPKLIENDYL